MGAGATWPFFTAPHGVQGPGHRPGLANQVATAWVLDLQHEAQRGKKLKQQQKP